MLCKAVCRNRLSGGVFKRISARYSPANWTPWMVRNPFRLPRSPSEAGFSHPSCLRRYRKPVPGIRRTCGSCGLPSESRFGTVGYTKTVLLVDCGSGLPLSCVRVRSRQMETPGTSTPKNTEGQFVSVQRLPYRSPALIEYGSVSKLTEGTASGTVPDGNPGD